MGDDAIELKPCPFCKSIDGPHLYTVTDGDGNDMEAYVQCEDCDAQGPTRMEAHDAVSNWNTRPEPDRSEARERIARLLISAMPSLGFDGAYSLARDIAGLVPDEASPVETISGRAYGLDVIDRLSKRKLTCRELARYIWDRAKNTPLAFEQDIARLIANERRQAVERSEASIRADEREKCAANHNTSKKGN